MPRGIRRNKGETEDNKVKPSEVRQAISQKKLRTLLASTRSAKQDINEITSTLGNEVKQAIENNHLHRRAFGIVRGLDRLEPEQLAETLDCLDHYLDISGLRDRAASAPRMEMGEAEEDGEDNVKQFPAAAE